MMEHAQDDRERAYLINRDIDAIRGTVIRQTMLTEFKKITQSRRNKGSHHGAIFPGRLRSATQGLLGS